jgi:hypothetical protein
LAQVLVEETTSNYLRRGTSWALQNLRLRPPAERGAEGRSHNEAWAWKKYLTLPHSNDMKKQH